MKFKIIQKSGKYHFEGTSETEHHTYTDASPDIGGTNKAMRPMEMVLMALGSCSSIDIVYLMDKQRQQMDDIEIEIEAKRRDIAPKVFTDVHLHFKLFGQIDHKKADRAVRISVEKQCSVAEMLKPNVNISHSFEIIER